MRDVEDRGKGQMGSLKKPISPRVLPALVCFHRRGGVFVWFSTILASIWGSRGDTGSTVDATRQLAG